MNIALIGPSGVGKGTHADTLVTKFNLLHIVTGELFRENLENRRAVGILAKKYMARGQLVPDEVVDAMIEERLWRADPQKGILFDGFPRTRYQANFLDGLFEELGRQLDAVIYLKVSDEEVIRRASGRQICHECQVPFHKQSQPFEDCPYQKCQGEHLYQRDDDIPEVIRVRLRTFHRMAKALLYYYQRTDRLIIIDGERNIDQVQSDLVDAVEAVQQGEGHFATVAEMEKIWTVELRPPSIQLYPSLDIVLIGGPGSGKGTQAANLTKKLDLPHVASGDLFRENLKNETELGKLAKTYMDRGELVPDDVTEAMVEERLSRPDAGAGFVLDGFPRTLPQAEALTEIMAAMQRKLDSVVYIKVSDSEIVKRLSGRFICQNCQTPYHLEFKPPTQAGICDVCGGKLYQRDDDNQTTVKARLETYHAQTAPVINYYRESKLLIEIDGEGQVSEVTDRMLSAADSLVQELR